MRNSTLWGIALAAVIGSGAVAATSLSPAYATVTRDVDAVSFTLDPASGKVGITTLQNITLTFPDIKGVKFVENYPNSIVLKNNTTGTEYICYDPDVQTRAEGGTEFKLVFLEEMPEFPEEAGGEVELPAINEDGSYTLTIKEGAFAYGEEDEDGVIANPIKVPEILANYSIGAGIDYTLDPVSGTEVSDLSVIQINFPTVKGVEFEPNFANSVLLINESTGTEYELAGDPDLNSRMEEGTTYDMHFVKVGESNVKAINEPGKYTLTIKQGAFVYGDDMTKVQSISANYTIAGVEYTLMPSNAEPVEDLQQLTINFPTLDDVEFVNNYTNSITLTNMSVGAEEEINAEYVLAGAIKDARSMNPGSTYILTFIKAGDEEIAPIIDPGKYVLQIKAGAFVYGRPVAGDADADTETPDTPDSELNKIQAITAVYTISGVTYALNPSTGSIKKDLSTIEINFPDITGVELVDKYVNSVLLENLTTGEFYTLAGAVQNAHSDLPGTTLNLVFCHEGELDVTPIVTPGDYKLTIKRGAFTYNDGQNIVQTIVALYRVPGIRYSLKPVNGTYVESITTIDLLFPSVKGIEYVENYTNSVLLTNVTTGTVYNLAGANQMDRLENGSGFTLHFVKEGQEEAAVITEPGVYELLIKEGAFDYANESEDAELEGERIKVQEITATYKIDGIAYVFDPESGSIVTDLSQVTLTIPEYKGVNISDEQSGIVLTNKTTQTAYKLAMAQMGDRLENGTAYTLYFVADSDEEFPQIVPITEPGEYELTIPEGVFYYGDEEETADKLPAMSASYVIEGTTTGVSEVLGEEASEYNVYTVNGVQVIKNGDKNAVKALPAGLYIINGKKVIVK